MESPERKRMNIEMTPDIRGASSIEDLYEVLKKRGGVEGSAEFFDADRMVRKIEEAVTVGRRGLAEGIHPQFALGKITRTDGVREKVLELLLAEKTR